VAPPVEGVRQREAQEGVGGSQLWKKVVLERGGRREEPKSGAGARLSTRAAGELAATGASSHGRATSSPEGAGECLHSAQLDGGRGRVSAQCTA
jgi:hypothetical protein